MEASNQEPPKGRSGMILVWMGIMSIFGIILFFVLR
jgi:hypothetical protein